MPLKPAKGPYEVGYKKPPKRTRFKPGQSGNPNGRPTGAKSVESAIDKVLSQKVKMNVDGRRRRVSVPEAVVLRVVQQALTGNSRAGLDLIKLVQDSARRQPSEPDPSEADQADIVRIVDCWAIVEGLTALGLCEPNEHGRPKVIQALIDIGLQQRPEAGRLDEVTTLRNYHVVGARDP